VIFSSYEKVSFLDPHTKIDSYSFHIPTMERIKAFISVPSCTHVRNIDNMKPITNEDILPINSLAIFPMMLLLLILSPVLIAIDFSQERFKSGLLVLPLVLMLLIAHCIYFVVAGSFVILCIPVLPFICIGWVFNQIYRFTEFT